MYRKKLEEQLIKLENLQKMCAMEHPDVSLAAADMILDLAAEIDEHDKNNPTDAEEPSTTEIPVLINGVVVTHLKVTLGECP